MNPVLELLDDICRLCLSETGVVNIFHPVNMTNFIFNITGVVVLESDVFPKSICAKCLNIVNDAQQLRLMSQKNDSHLRSLINENHKSEAELSVNAPSCSKVDSTLQTDEGSDSDATLQLAVVSDVESDVTVESLLKRKKKHSTSQKDRIRREFVCEECNKAFATRKKLSLHSRTHKRNYICPFDTCCKTFASKNDLRKHNRSHTGERPYKCDRCDKSFTQNGVLKQHKRNIHFIYD